MIPKQYYVALCIALIPNFVAIAQDSDTSVIERLIAESSINIPSGKTLHVSSRYFSKSLWARDENVSLTESCDAIDWYLENNQKQRSLFLMDKQKVPWINGPREHSTVKLATFFDGTAVKTITQNYGTKGNLLVGATCNISEFDLKAKDEFQQLATGHAFLLTTLFNKETGKFSRYLRQASNVEVNERDGIIELTARNEGKGSIGEISSNIEIKIAASPSPHLISLKNTSVFSGKSGEVTNVHSYIVSDTIHFEGVPYPKKAEYILVRNGKEVTRFNTEITDIKFIEGFPAEPLLPALTTVIDERTGERFRTGDAPSKLVDQISGMLEAEEDK